MRQLTRTELEAYTRRKAFHLEIELRAAQLHERAAAPAVAAPQELAPEAMPAETDPPAPVLDEPRRLMAREVQAAVAEAFEVDLPHIKGPRRTAGVVLARQVAMMLCKELCWANSLPALGREFGGRDHTTILHACRVAPYKIAAAGLQGKVDKLRETLRLASLRPLPNFLAPRAPPVVREARKFPSVRAVQNLVAHYFGVDPDSLRGRNRDSEIKQARAVAYYLACEACGLSVPLVALSFDGRHHASAYEGRDAVQLRMIRDVEFCKEVVGLLALLNGEGK